MSAILAGEDPPAAAHHVVYIALEAVKLAALLYVGSRSLARLSQPHARPS